MVFAVLIAILLVAQLEDLATAGHMMSRLGSIAERGPLAGTAYEAYGLPGLIALKIGLFAIIVGASVLLVRVGRFFRRVPLILPASIPSTKVFHAFRHRRALVRIRVRVQQA